MYVIVDIQTQRQVGKEYSSRKLASNQANRMDLKYGAVRYIVKPI